MFSGSQRRFVIGPVKSDVNSNLMKLIPNILFASLDLNVKAIPLWNQT